MWLSLIHIYYEDQILLRLKAALREDVKVTIIADRGFFDIKLFDFLKKELNFDYSIRVRNNIHITDSSGDTKKASEWIPKNGQTKTLRKAKITADNYEVGLVAIKHQKGMKQPWCIVSVSYTHLDVYKRQNLNIPISSNFFRFIEFLG